MITYDIYDLPYTINTDWKVFSTGRQVEYINAVNGVETKYWKPPQELKIDYKVMWCNCLARVQLYDEQGFRKCYYVARLLYSFHYGVPYDRLTQIHYKDGDSKNLNINNLIHSLSGITR